MNHSMKMRSAVCIAALVAGGAAHADVTAQEVWDSWQEQMGMFAAADITVGSEEMSGDTLVVSGLSVSTAAPEISTSYTIDEIRFSEDGDNVVITMSESYPITFSPESNVEINLEATNSGLEMIVSGDVDAMNYEMTADSIAIALKDVVDGDMTFTGDAQIVLNDLSGNYTTVKDALMTVDYDMAIASMDMLVDIQLPGGNGEYITGGGKIMGMNLDATVAMPLDADFENPEMLFADGFAVNGGYTVESADYIFDVNADGDQLAGSATMGTADFAISASNAAIVYDVSAKDVAISATGSEVPFPIELSFAEYGIGFEMPLGKSDAPEDFRMSIDLIDMAINEMIWGMIDPGNILPRDPATLQIGLSGTAQPMINMMNPEEQDSLEYGELPFELNTLSLDTLNVSVAGAAVTGSGDFTFDPTDTQTFAPMPRPEGEAAIKVNGLNQLIDNLIAMGLVPEEQVMGPRMMIGMFAQTTGEDQLETSLEVNGEGHVLVNGQRVK
ncbi:MULTISPECIES: DUF2125 domain-containing protein [Rhodobacterales]|uniref:DUF2125 domain-containing protein n=1 Tax=Rhodobacterales TaxID=204455 RepID=UPI00215DA114|nr:MULTISPECIES: DUF2125 domain-containing protein [Rhodobacterales]MDO6591987.1 DUF2125 domain-containing protein [Yoonia sp. 1_MG-2023]